MNIFFYTIIFIIGIFFGSFFTLAVYRIPKKEDILIKHSYCPNCNHKLGFFELIPVLSYILLGGKCKNCKEKIRIRYLILEVLSGLLFVLFALLLKLDIYNFNIDTLIFFVFLILYFVSIILIAGIDKEHRKIEQSLLSYGIIVSVFYIVYLCIKGETSIYRYAIYLLAYLLAYITNICESKKTKKDNYTLSMIMLMILVAIATNEVTAILSVAMTLFSISIYNILSKFKFKEKNNKENVSENIHICFIFCVSSVIVLMVQLFTINYIF